MKLSTGKVGFPIEFDNGDKQNIYFNPSDPDLLVRLKDLQRIVDERIKSLNNIQLTLDGNPADDEDMDVVEQFRLIQNIIYEEIDRAFGGDVSSVVFKYCSPFAVVNGDYFLLQFIDVICPEIEKHMKSANLDAEKRISKHIDKYKK